MKRNYQGYSGSGPSNANLPAPPTMAYPPLPSGPPPPQPASNTTGGPSTNSSQYQPQQQPSNSIHHSPSQSYQYGQQFSGTAAAAPYAQYSSYTPQQQASSGYQNSGSGGAAPGSTPFGYNPQLPPNPQQQQQQQSQHPAYANYGYGTPAGPQQPPKASQSYQSYQHPANANALPSNPVTQYGSAPPSNIPPNPYTGFTPGQANSSALQGSPGSAAPPPYKRPRYENTAGSGAYGTAGTPQPGYPASTPQHGHNQSSPGLPPLRNSGVMSGTAATPMRMGSNTSHGRGGFSGNRAPRSSGGPFGNNSPIRLGMGGAGVGGFDGGNNSFYDGNQSHQPQPMTHPLPPHHQPQHGPSSSHYPHNPSFNGIGSNSNANNSSDNHYSANSSSQNPANYPSSNAHDQGNSASHRQAPGDGARHSNANNHNFSPSHGGGSSYMMRPSSNSNDNYNFHDDSRGNPSNTGNRGGRGTFRGNGGGAASGGKGNRDRGSEAGGDGPQRGNRGMQNHSFGSSTRGDRHTPGNKGRGGNGGGNNRFDDHPSNHGPMGMGAGGPSRHNDRSCGPGNRGSRNGAVLPSGGSNKSNHYHDRRSGGGGNRFASSGSGERNSGNRNSRRNNGRDSKFDDHRTPHRLLRSGGGQNNSNNSNNERGERGRNANGPAGTRIKNGWGAQFKEFSEREKDKEKTEEAAPTKRTLTDFRINALEIPDLEWSWLSDKPDGAADIGTSTIASTLEEAKSKGSSRPQAEPSTTKAGKHSREEDESTRENGVASEGVAADPSDRPDPSVSASGSKKIKPDMTVELTKKIDEEAASAVKGLNLTVDDQSSEPDEDNADDEVKAGLLLSNQEPPHTASQHKSDSEGKDAGSVTEPSKNDSKASSKLNLEGIGKTEATPAAVTTPKPSTSVVDLTTPAPNSVRESRVHLYSKPTIPAGRENSRLRLYFSSPSADQIAVSNPAGLPTKPTPAAIGKRKLSVSGNSAMSAEAKLGAAGRGSSPASAMSPLKGMPKNQGRLLRANNDSPLGKLSAGDSNSKLQPKASSVSGVEPGLSDTNKDKTKPPEDSEKQPAQTKAEPSGGEGNTKDSTTDEKKSQIKEEQADDSKADETFEEDADADGDYEEDDDEDDDYEEPPVPEPQADRLSISYACNTRRIVIDSDVVESVKVYRAEHKVEVLVRLLPAIISGGKFSGQADEYRVCKGVLVEALDQEIDDYVIIDRATLEATWRARETDQDNSNTKGPNDSGAVSEVKEETDSGVGGDEADEALHDSLLPPLHRLLRECLEIDSDDEGEKRAESEDETRKSEPKVTACFKQDTVLIVAKLDTANPLTEAKWVRTGDVDSWISQMTGRIFKPEDKSECGWRRKITVVDPDPPPTIQHLLDTWLTTSAVGSIDSRQRFIDRHVAKNVDIIIEILLRVIRTGTNAAAHHQANPTPLIVQQAATLHAPYPEQQTQVSLAVLGLYRLSIETALEAGVAVDKVVKKATDIVRSLPYRLAFGALDSIYKDETPS